ncbi:response regulator [Haliangium sp.]|uniref:hybrid sensor histidine kinase/response regulator n=1 Tax=Haliangium sp. TaxID=2663208 RepID=UPI003D109240
MATRSSPEIAIPASPDGRRTVVAMDDDPASLALIERALADRYEVIGCASGWEGLAHLDPGIYAIILDVKTRGEEGRWIFDAIRKRCADVPVILFSAFHGEPGPYPLYNDCRPFGFLRKGADAAELRRLVDEAADERALRLRREAHLLVADRLAAVGTLAAGAAHEINNPLGYILGNIEYVLEELRSVGHVFEHGRLSEIECALAAALDGAQRIAHIVHDLRSFGGAGGRRAGGTSDVREELERALRLAANEIRHRARLVTELEEVPPVVADPEILAQIFLNLMVNAAQALPIGQAEAHEIRVRCARLGRRSVVVEIHDTGPGIPLEVRERIFDPFFTTKAPNLGPGLGLFVTHNLVQEIGGTIQVSDNTPGPGSRFQVTLPAVVPDDEADEDQGRRVIPFADARRRVLIVDDDPLVGHSLTRMLSMYDVTFVSDGREGVERCVDARFDVVLCDLMMPELDGMGFYEALAALVPGMEERVLFMSGGVFDPEIVGFLESIPNLHIEKPIRREPLLGMIDAILVAPE